MAAPDDELLPLCLRAISAVRELMQHADEHDLRGGPLLRSALGAVDAFKEMHAPRAPVHREPIPEDRWAALAAAEEVYVLTHDTPTVRVAERTQECLDRLRELAPAEEEGAPRRVTVCPRWNESESGNMLRRLLMRLSAPDRRYPLLFYRNVNERLIRYAGSFADA